MVVNLRVKLTRILGETAILLGKLKAKLRGHYNYIGVVSKLKDLWRVYSHVLDNDIYLLLSRSKYEALELRYLKFIFPV